MTKEEEIRYEEGFLGLAAHDKEQQALSSSWLLE
jgi:hypothetical protein